jgi:PAS domain S-box-containing protein
MSEKDMRNNNRSSGIDILGDIPWGTHFCQFYQTKEDLMDVLVPYFKTGLENNELCIWIIPRSLNAKEAKEVLRKAIPCFDTYLEKGQFEFVPYADWYLNEDAFNSHKVDVMVKKISHALDSGYDGLRLSGDVFWLEEADRDGFINYKKEVDNAIGNCQIITLFTYSLDKCDVTEIVDVVSNHQFSLIKKKGKWERIENSGWKRSEETVFRVAKDWKRVFDAVPDLIAIIDNKCRIVRANKAMAARLGTTPEDCAGLNCYRVVHGTDMPPSFCPHQQLLKDGLEHTIELQEDKLGGSFVLSVSHLFSPEGKIIGCVHVARDISERKQAEKALCQAYEKLQTQSREIEGFYEKLQAQSEKLKEINDILRESEEKYRALFENSLDGIFLTVPNGNILAANPAACKMFGMREKEIIRAGRNGTVDTSDPRLKSILEERARTGRFKGELNHRRKDGTIFPAEISSASFKDKNGLAKMVIIIRDITERKKAEEVLQKSEERYRMLFTNMTEAFLLGELIFDKDGKPYDYRFLDANPAYERMTGRKREQLAGKSVLELSPSMDTIVAEKYGEDILSGEPANFEVFSPITGKYFDIYAFSPEKGKIAIIFRDITQRKRMENALKEAYQDLEEKIRERTAELEKAYNSLKESERGLAEAQKMAHLGSWYRSFITDKIHLSDETYRIFGLKPQEFEVTYNEFLSFIYPDDRDYVDKAVKKALNGESYSIDFRIILANEEERIVHTQGEAVFDGKNILIGIRGTVQDITEHKIAEEALEKMEETRIKEIHHRIKNNLQVISSLLSLQAEKFTDLKTVEAFKDSQNRVISMALIHEELFRGKGTDNLDFAAYIKKLTQELFSSYNLRNEDISLKLNLEQVYLGMDTAIPLGIIVNELVSNSLKHAFQSMRKGEISISLKKTEGFHVNNESSEIGHICREANFQYVLTVEDNGKGIPEEIDLQNADSLGLRLVNILVEQIEGCIELERNQGTQFTIWFSGVEK